MEKGILPSDMCSMVILEAEGEATIIFLWIYECYTLIRLWTITKFNFLYVFISQGLPCAQIVQ